MSFEIEGTIIKIFETVQVSDRFSKREFAIEYADNPRYPQQVKMQVSGDRCAQLDDVATGDQVRISFNVRGRQFTSKKTGDVDFFTNLEAWKIEPVDGPRQSVRRGKKRDESPPSDEVSKPIDDGEIPF